MCLSKTKSDYPRTYEKKGPTQKSKKYIGMSINKFKNLNIKDKDGWLEGYIQSDPEKRLAKDIDMIDRYLSRGDKICEYGAAPFILTEALNEKGYNVTGIDLNPERFSNLQKLDLKIKKIDIEKEKTPFPDQYFDAVVFNELFEHLRKNIIFTMKEVRRILKRDGILFLSTPNLNSINGLFNILIKDKNSSSASNLYHEWSKINKIGHMGHVREYTETEIVYFLKEIGFEPVEVIYRGNYEGDYIKFKIWNIMIKFLHWFKPNMTLIFSVK